VRAGLLLTETAVGGYNDGECWVSSGCSGEDYFFVREIEMSSIGLHATGKSRA